jgi:hypothetical protein
MAHLPVKVAATANTQVSRWKASFYQTAHTIRNGHNPTVGYNLNNATRAALIFSLL